MNAGEFAKHRARIDRSQNRRRGYQAKALAQLVKESGAAIIIALNRVVGWRLPNGQIVCSKRRYSTLEAAEVVLFSSIENPMTRVVPNRAYKCPHCNGWHLTKQQRH